MSEESSIVIESPTEEQKEFLEQRRADLERQEALEHERIKQVTEIDEDGDKIIRIPVGVFIEKSPKKKGRKGKKGGDDVVEEEGIEYEYKKIPKPTFALSPGLDDGNDVLAEMPEFWGMQLVKVPYKRMAKKSMKLGYTGEVQMKMTKLGPIPVYRRRKTPVPAIVPGEGEDYLYEDIPDDEMYAKIDEYIIEYVKLYGGNPEDVQVPYMTPRRPIDLSKKTTEEILKICRDRKLKCNTLVKEVAAKYEDEEERDAAIRRALISRIEGSLQKAAVIPRPKEAGRSQFMVIPSPKKAALKRQQNPYNRNYPIATRVEFVDTKGITRRGLVRSFARPGITVVADRIEFKIKYTNKTLKVIPVEEGKQKTPESPESQETAIYRMTEIPKSLRERVVDVYCELLTEIKGLEGKEAAKSPSNKVAAFSLVPPVPWNEYYESNFHAWRWQMYSKGVFDGLDFAAIDQYVKEETEENKDYNMLLETVLGIMLDNLGEQITTETTAEDVIRAFNIKKHLTPFEARFVENFTRLYNTHQTEEGGKLGMGKFATPKRPYGYIERGKFHKKEESKYRKSLGGKRPGSYKKKKTPEGLEEPKVPFFPEKPAQVPAIKGENLARMIDIAIREYIKVLPSVNRDLVIENAIKEGLESLDQAALREIFDGTHKAKMEADHAAYEKYYHDEYDKYLDMLDEIKAKGEVESVDKTSVVEEVKRFEEIVYLNHGRGKNVYHYLRRVLIPYIFMHGPIAKHAKFFRAKLANGMFRFSGLASANIAHYLPEFVMGIQDHLDAEIDALFLQGPWFTLAESFEYVRRITIRMFMASYVSILNPMMQRKMNNELDGLWHAGEPLVKILVTPVSACQSQTGTGTRPVIQNNEYVYRVVGRGLGKHRIQAEEVIPEGDLVICFDEGKFSCLSVRDIAIAIVRAGSGKPINTQSGKPYPDDFIKRFRQQHGGVIDEIAATGVPSDVAPSGPLPKTPTPPKPKVAPKKKAVSKRKHHVPVKGKKFKEVTGLLLMGDEIDNIPGYKDELEIPLEGEDTLVVSLENKKKTANVAVIAITVDSEGGPDMGELKEQLLNVPKNIKDVYIIGVGEITGKYKNIYSARIKKLDEAKNVKQIFYSDRQEDSILDTLIDVVIDVEGVQVRGVGKKGSVHVFDVTKMEEKYEPYYTPGGGWRYSDEDEKERPPRKPKTPKPRSPAKRVSPKQESPRASMQKELEKVQEILGKHGLFPPEEAPATPKVKASPEKRRRLKRRRLKSLP